ncbi:MAG: hypothetical protein JWP94_3666 [Mucilaginibacter sp.]|jgi:hypothetical protein|nr:hypothetical protein [Mucilaginibacter sp.]
MSMKIKVTITPTHRQELKSNHISNKFCHLSNFGVDSLIYNTNLFSKN